MIHNICTDNSIASKYVADLRDVHKQADSVHFRKNMELLGSIFAYEISKTFKYEKVRTETPLGTAISEVPVEDVVLLTIMRAGLPIHQGMLNVLGNVDNGFIAAQRLHHKDGSFEVAVDYITCPEVEGRTVIISDPMLASGSSMANALEAVYNIGKPKRVHVVSIIAASYGLNYVRRLYPKAHFWIAAQDEELTAKSYIVPGLGDAGDLAYGGKRDV